MERTTGRRVTRRTALGLGALAAAAALALAGCSASGDAGDSRADELTVWHYYTLDNQLKMLDEYATTFAETHPGVTVDYVYVPMDQMNSKLIAAAGARTGPDVVIADGFNIGTLAGAGTLAPLDEQWNGYADKDRFAEGALKVVDGTVYGVQGHVNALALWYNQDILDEVGIAPPTSMSELEAALTAVTAAGHQGITLSGDPTIQGAFQAYSWLTDAGFSYDSPQAAPAEAAFARVRGWIEKGYLSPQASTWDQNVPFSEFLAGNVAFAQNGNWQLTSARTDASFRFGVVPLPLSDTGKIYLGGEAESIGAFAKRPDLAWDYLQATYLSAQGQITALEAVGSLPTRDDASKAEAISTDPVLAAFAAAMDAQGAPYPDAVLPPGDAEKILLASAQAWSAALSGATSPADAAAEFLRMAQPLLGRR
jgi:multiple sugar transport system substrate-binding protein